MKQQNFAFYLSENISIPKQHSLMQDAAVEYLQSAHCYVGQNLLSVLI